jgi:hypothetical protein
VNLQELDVQDLRDIWGIACFCSLFLSSSHIGMRVLILLSKPYTLEIGFILG